MYKSDTLLNSQAHISLDFKIVYIFMDQTVIIVS